MAQVKAGAQTARLITINHDGKSYDIVPGGAGSVAVQIPDSAAKIVFVKALVDSGDLILTDVGEDEADDGDIDALRAQADALGIEYDKRWGVKKLQSAIDAA